MHVTEKIYSLESFKMSASSGCIFRQRYLRPWADFEFRQYLHRRFVQSFWTEASLMSHERLSCKTSWVELSMLTLRDAHCAPARKDAITLQQKGSMFVSSDRSSCTDDGLLYIRGSSSHFFRFWAFMPFYTVTSVTLCRLNSIDAIDVTRVTLRH